MATQLARRFLVGVLALAATLGSASGQGGPLYGLPPGRAEAFSPDYVQRDLRVLSEGLSLRPDQQVVAETLMEEYRRQFSAQASAVSAALADLRPAEVVFAERRQEIFDALQTRLEEANERFEEAGDQSMEAQRALMQEMMALKANADRESAALHQQMSESGEGADNRARIIKTVDEWIEQKAALRDRFEHDLLAIITEPQRERWPGVERRLRREKALGAGRLSGEAVDLIGILHQLQIKHDAVEDLSAVVDEYALRLDDAVRTRDRALQQTATALDEAVSRADADEAYAILRRTVDHRVMVRDINHAFASRIAGLLPAETAQSFMARYRQRAFPRLYRRTGAERQFRAAAGLGDIEPETRSAIDELREEYEAILDTLNAQGEDVLRREEPAATVLAEARRAGLLVDRPTDDPITDFLVHHNEEGLTYVDRLRGLLSAEQVQMLPGGGRPLRAEAVDEAVDVGSLNRSLTEQFDADGDGRLNDEESPAPKPFLRAQGAPEADGDR